MSWSDRMKKAFQAFKRMALPLYAWYFILAILGVVLVFISLIPMIVSLVHSGMFNSGFSGIPGFPGLPDVPSSPGVPTPPFSGTYPNPNPNPPVPPGSNLTPGPQGLMNGIAPYLSLAPTLILSFLGVIALSWLLSSAFMTGIFNLSKKAYSGPAKFKDFRFKGCFRVLGWYGLLTLIGVLLVGLGVFIAIALRDINYAIPIFAVVFALLVCAIAIFLAPWLSTSAFYMLNHRELSFSKSFRESWRFYRRHIGSFWGYFITAIGIQIILSIIDRNSPDIGLILALLITPFTTILPVIWVLTHEEEEGNYQATIAPAYEHPTPDYLRVVAPQEVSAQEGQAQENNTQENTVQDDTDQNKASGESHSSISESPSSANLQSNPLESRQESLQKLTKPSQESSKEPFPPQYTPHIIPYEDAENAQINYCPTCGKNVRPGASYCSQCGTKL